MTDKSVAEKGHVKPDTTVAVLNPAQRVVESLGLPRSVRFVPASKAQIVFLFVQTPTDLDERMPAAVRQLAPGAVLWVFFRKGSKSAGLAINRNDVWAVAERLGMRPLGLLSVDAEWSAFRLKPAT